MRTRLSLGLRSAQASLAAAGEEKAEEAGAAGEEKAEEPGAACAEEKAGAAAGSGEWAASLEHLVAQAPAFICARAGCLRAQEHTKICQAMSTIGFRKNWDPAYGDICL